MKSCFLLFFSVFLWITSVAQTDSTEIKLQQYKDLHIKGLINDQEYEALKAKTLGLNLQSSKPQEQVDKSKITEIEFFYDTTLQSKILPKGLYLSFDEIKSREPSRFCKLFLEWRRDYDYQNGVQGNVRLSPRDKCISKKNLDKDVWIYSDGVKCYMNLEQVKLQSFYSPIITMGRFLAFYKNQISDGAKTARDWGGSVGVEIAMATGHSYKKLYVVDTDSAMLYVVDDEYMLRILKDYPDINAKYISEKGTKDNKFFAKYLQVINDSSGGHN